MYRTSFSCHCLHSTWLTECSTAAVENQLAQKQPEITSGEGSVDLGSIASLQDWSWNDLDDDIQAGVAQNSPQLVVESHQDTDKNEEATARLPSENRNDFAMQIKAPPSVQTAVQPNISSTMAVSSLPDLLHSDRCVEQGLIPAKTA